jgi:hypothetical protein
VTDTDVDTLAMKILRETSTEIRVAEGLLDDLGITTSNLVPDTLKLEKFAELLSRIGKYAKTPSCLETNRYWIEYKEPFRTLETERVFVGLPSPIPTK